MTSYSGFLYYLIPSALLRFVSSRHKKWINVYECELHFCLLS